MPVGTAEMRESVGLYQSSEVALADVSFHRIQLKTFISISVITRGVAIIKLRRRNCEKSPISFVLVMLIHLCLSKALQ